MARPCGSCGEPTTNTVEMYVGGRGWRPVPHCGADEGCGLAYQRWLRETGKVA